MNKDYIDEDKDFGAELYEDPEQTIESRGRWVLPILLVVVLPVLAMVYLHETSRDSREPLLQAMLNGMPTARESGAIGTTGRDRSVAESLVVYSIHELEGVPGDRQALVGRKVELHMPAGDIANDQAFWVGGKDSRLLVVPSRDHRDIVQRQAGFIAGNNIAPLEAVDRPGSSPGTTSRRSRLARRRSSPGPSSRCRRSKGPTAGGSQRAIGRSWRLGACTCAPTRSPSSSDSIRRYARPLRGTRRRAGPPDHFIAFATTLRSETSIS
jgi:hypothetical protein